MLSDATQKWWAEHKQIDAERNAREQAKAEQQAIRTSALGKLTSDERKALGL